MSFVSRFIYMPERCNQYVHYILDFRNPNRQPPVSINVFKYRKHAASHTYKPRASYRPIYLL